MNSVLESFVNNSIVETIGWTLVHFLWQASVIALVVFLVSLFTRRSSSKVRYGLFAVGMIVMVMCPLATMAAMLQFGSSSLAANPSRSIDKLDRSVDTESGAAAFHMATANHQNIPQPPVSIDMESGNLTTIESVSVDFESWLPILVGLWLFGVTVQLVFMLIGMMQIYQWKKRATELQDSHICMIFDSLVAKLQVQNVSLKSTTDLSVSAVVGFWKPLVLMPSAMLTGLSAKEMELVLAHELAHVRRYDFMVNILQKFFTSVFFFHPAIWWISQRIAIERENCCDDIATDICGDRVALAKALANMEAIRCKQLAIAANGGILVSRIRRLLENDYVPARSPWPVGGLAVLMLLISVSFVPAGVPKSDLSSEAAVSGDSTNDPKTEVNSNQSKESQVQTVKKEGIKIDPVTGIEQRVFENIKLTTKSDQGSKSTTVDLKYSNVIPYSFIPQKVAKALSATKLGEIDFAKYRDVDANNVVWSFIPNDFANPTGYIADGESRTFVDIVTKPQDGQIIVPYLNDPLPAEKHLGFYGLNQTQQTKFDVVRIDEVDLGIGKKFGPVNALVLSDKNSAFGLLGSKWGAMVRGENGQSLWHFAVGGFRLMPSSHGGDANSQSRDTNRRPVEEDFGDIQKVLMKVAVENDVLKHVALKSIDVGRSATELIKHFSMIIERHGSPQRVQSITNMESIVSAHSAKRSGNTIEANEIVFSLPEGSNARASISGASVKLSATDGGMRAVVENGQVQWIDSVGVVRAIAKAPSGGRLIVDTKVDNNEVVMKMSVRDLTNDGNRKVQVTTNLKSGAPDDEEQPPHGRIRYEIFDEDKNDDKPLRLKMKWRYDVGRLAKEAEVESGKPWQKIIWGDDHPINEEKENQKDKTNDNAANFRSSKNDETDSNDDVQKRPWHVKGRVVNESGEPVPGVVVYAYCGYGSLRRTGEGKTDSSGKFDFRFGPGIFSSNKKLVQAATISVQMDGFVEKNLHRQGDLVAALEMPDEIGWGGKTKDQLFLPGKTIELEFVMIQSVAVSGYVFDSEGQPKAGYKISLRGSDMPPSQSGAAFATTGDDGKYVLANIPPGFEYQVLVRPKKRGHPWLAWASVPLSFSKGDSDMTRIDYSRNDQDVDFACANLNFILNGEGENWRTALKSGAEKKLKLAWQGNQDSEKIRTDSADLVLNR